MPIPPKLLFLFIAVPVIEVILFVKIGGAIGLGYTLVIIVVTAVVGAWLTRAQGVKAIQKLQFAVAEGKPPHAELFDGIIILIAGVLLITPGFFTDALGFLLLAPPVRAYLRSRITATIGSRMVPNFDSYSQSPHSSHDSPAEKKAPKARRRGKIIDAEIVDD